MEALSYTRDDLVTFLRSGKIDPLLWLLHFPETADWRMPGCIDCVEFRSRRCAGGSHPVDCFLAR